MATVKEKDLTQVASLADADFIRAVSSTGESEIVKYQTIRQRIVDEVMDEVLDAFTVRSLTKPTITKTGGNSTCTVQAYVGYGRIRMLALSFQTTGTTNAGANVFTGTISEGDKPVISTGGVGYLEANTLIGTLGGSGALTIRNLNATLASGKVPWVYFTYIVAE